MFHNSLQFYAAVVKLADAMDSKSIGLILRAGSTPASGTKSEQFEPFSNFIMVSNCFTLTLKNSLNSSVCHVRRGVFYHVFVKQELRNIFSKLCTTSKIFFLKQPKMWKFFLNHAIMES